MSAAAGIAPGADSCDRSVMATQDSLFPSLPDPPTAGGEVDETRPPRVLEARREQLELRPVDLEAYRSHFEFIGESRFGAVMVPRESPDDLAGDDG